MDPLQWMGAVGVRVQTALKHKAVSNKHILFKDIFLFKLLLQADIWVLHS